MSTNTQLSKSNRSMPTEESTASTSSFSSNKDSTGALGARFASTSSTSNTNNRHCKVWFGNLDTKLPEYQVLKIAEKFGAVAEFDFLYQFNEKGERCPRGYAFVTYRSSDSAALAVERLDRQRILGRDISVRYANAKNEASLRAASTRASIMATSSSSSSSSGSGAKSATSGGLSLPAALRGKNILNIDTESGEGRSVDSSADRERRIRALEAKLRMLEKRNDDFTPSTAPSRQESQKYHHSSIQARNVKNAEQGSSRGSSQRPKPY